MEYEKIPTKDKSLDYKTKNIQKPQEKQSELSSILGLKKEDTFVLSNDRNETVDELTHIEMIQASSDRKVNMTPMFKGSQEDFYEEEAHRNKILNSINKYSSRNSSSNPSSKGSNSNMNTIKSGDCVNMSSLRTQTERNDIKQVFDLKSPVIGRATPNTNMINININQS